MKDFTSLLPWLVLFTGALLTGCVTPKQLSYFQESDPKVNTVPVDSISAAANDIPIDIDQSDRAFITIWIGHFDLISCRIGMQCQDWIITQGNCSGADKFTPPGFEFLSENICHRLIMEDDHVFIIDLISTQRPVM